MPFTRQEIRTSQTIIQTGRQTFGSNKQVLTIQSDTFDWETMNKKVCLSKIKAKCR